MLDICSICLGTGIKLQALGEALESLFGDLCCVETDGNALYCCTCVHLIRKFCNFRKKCEKANYVLNKWKKESEITRIPLNELHTKVSPSSLGLSINANRAIYCYNVTEDYTECSSYSNINNLNSCNDKGAEFIKSSDNNSKKNEAAAIHVQMDHNYHILDDSPITSEEFKTQSDDDDTNNYVDVEIYEDTNYDDKLSMREVLNKRNNNSEQLEDELKLTRKLDMDNLKSIVKNKLGNDDVKDKDGNVIDIEAILNNLDKMEEKTLRKIWRCCSDEKPLTPEAIEILSQVQKRCGIQFSSVFITKHLTTDKEIMEEVMTRQFNQNYLESDHKCTLCFKYFNSAKMLEYHINRMHDESNPYACRYCGIRVPLASSLRTHELRHRVVYQCKLCPIVTNRPDNMEAHFGVHQGLMRSCKLCNAVFKCMSSLAVHMNRVHYDCKWNCSYCARKFRRKGDLYRHMKLKHQNDVDSTVEPPSVKCEECNTCFISEEVYQDHLRQSHKRDSKNRMIRKYTCRICRHVEPSLGSLMWHFKSEHPTEEFDMRRIALREPYKYLCHECGKGFKDITTLTTHKNIHAGVRPYSCPMCPKAFYSKNHLSGHMKYHLPPTYQCPYCPKKFHSGCNLSTHKRLHTGDRRYACDICGKAFLHQGTLNEHKRSVHQHIRRNKKPKKQTNVSELEDV